NDNLSRCHLIRLRVASSPIERESAILAASPLAIPNDLFCFYLWSILVICLFACSNAWFTLSSSTTTSSWMVSSLIFFASLRASFMAAEICFSLGGSVLLGSFTVTLPGHLR